MPHIGASSARSSSTLSIIPLFQISSNQRRISVAASGCSLSRTTGLVADIRASIYFGGTVTQTDVRGTLRRGRPAHLPLDGETLAECGHGGPVPYGVDFGLLRIVGVLASLRFDLCYFFWCRMRSICWRWL